MTWLLALLIFAQNDADLAPLLERLKLGPAQDRIDAAKKLGERVQRPPEGAAAGFSDKTVERPAPAPRLPDDLVDKAATALAEAANDPEPKIREAASIALAGLSGTRPALQAALIRALQSKDSTVSWYVLQAFPRVRPDPAQAVAVLLPYLDLPDAKSLWNIASHLGEFGPAAKSAVPALIRLTAAKSDSSMNASSALNALARIGIDEAQARSLSAMKLEPAKELDLDRFEVLIPHPEIATAYLQERPRLLEEMIAPEKLFLLVESADPAAQPLRKALLDRADVPPLVMAWSLEPRFQAALGEKLKKANKHEATLLKACLRACGAPQGPPVLITDKDLGDFKPKSAWPDTDNSRKGTGGGHGDGHTPVLVTGRLLMADGSIPVEPRFVNENDRMLLGTRSENTGPLRFDPKTGRFVFSTHVFAAYAMGKQEEPGPYQTGSAQVRIESKGSKPLVVRFYDEMPDVQITLPAAK